MLKTTIKNELSLRKFVAKIFKCLILGVAWYCRAWRIVDNTDITKWFNECCTLNQITRICGLVQLIQLINSWCNEMEEQPGHKKIHIIGVMHHFYKNNEITIFLKVFSHNFKLWRWDFIFTLVSKPTNKVGSQITHYTWS